MQKRTFAQGVALTMWLTVSGCSPASAIAPDSGNPAHCIAVYSVIRREVLSLKPPKVVLALQLTARSIFEGKKLKEAGTLDEGADVGERLLKDLLKDSEAVDELARQCMVGEDANPAYRVLNDSGQLMKAAKIADPACQAEPECKASIK